MINWALYTSGAACAVRDWQLIYLTSLTNDNIFETKRLSIPTYLVSKGTLKPCFIASRAIRALKSYSCGVRKVYNAYFLFIVGSWKKATQQCQKYADENL